MVGVVMDGTLAQAHTANMQSSLGLPDGYTVLHAACHAGNAKVVKYLLSRCCHRCHTGGQWIIPQGQPWRWWHLDEVDMRSRTVLERRPPLLWGLSEMNGRRINMEDRMLVEYNA